MKYKIHINEGCTSFSTIVNGVSWSGEDPRYFLSQEQQHECIDYLVEKLRVELKSGNAHIDDLIRMFQYEDYETDDTICDTCGDTTSTTTWEL
jgi:hypothetical protein